MRATLRAQQRHFAHRPRGDGESVRGAIRPVCLSDVEGRGGKTGEKIRGNEDFNAVFLRETSVFGVGTGDKDASVLEEDGFAVVEAVDGCVGHDGHTLVDGFGGVVED